MSIKAVRDLVAAGADAHADIAVGYGRPPGDIADLPAVVVQDPTAIRYHTAMGARRVIEVPVRVIVPRDGEEDSTERLDDLLTYAELPATLEAIDGTGVWLQLVADDVIGGYFDVLDPDHDAVIGLGADIACTIVTT